MKTPLRSSLRVQFAIVVGVVFVFALGMAIFLNYFKYQKSLKDLISSRITVIGLDLQNAMEYALALGLNLTDIPTLQTLIDREKSSDDLIRQVDVISSEGRILYSTDQAVVKTIAPAEWRDAVAKTNGKYITWQVEGRTATVVGVPVKNAFDLVVGFVVLRYETAYLDAKVQKMGRQLGGLAGVIVVVGVLLTAVGLSFVLSYLIRDLNDVAGPLDALAASGHMPALPHPAGSHPLERQVSGFGTAIAEANDELLAIDRRLDETARA